MSTVGQGRHVHFWVQLHIITIHSMQLPLQNQYFEFDVELDEAIRLP
jgi:hypothetical protein